MRSTSLAVRKAGAALAVLMLSTALAACQPNSSTDATAPTAVPTATNQTGNSTDNPGGSTASPGGSTGGSGNSTDNPGGSGNSTDNPGGSTASPGGSTGGSGNSTGSPGGSQGDVPRGLESFYNQTIDWKDCSDGTASFQCGMVTVPLDYEHPDGQTITIAVRKLAASDGNAEHGSLFLNPGGPGGSGVAMMQVMAPMLTEETRGAYDIIGFDPRGVGQSTPITCWTNDEIKQHLANPSDDAGPTDPLKGVMYKNVAAQEKIDRGTANAARCAQHSQVPELLDHVGTRNVARDLDILRATNSNAKLNYLGVSYGTYIGAIYADLFPDHVGRVVLDSAMDPSKRSGGEIRAEQITFLEGALRQYVEHCQAQDGCPLTGSTDEAVAQLAAFVDGLDKNPLTAPDSDATVNTQDATVIIQRLAVAQPDWEALTAMLTPAMTNRDGTLMVKAKQGSNKSSTMPVEAAAYIANSEIMFAAVICNDDPDTGGTASDWDAQAAAEKKTYPFFGGTSSAMDAYCQGWGHRGKTPPQETRAKGSDPILVVGIKGDIQTLYSWAQSLAGQLDNGHLLTVEGYGHGAFGTNSCASTAITGFLVNGTMPAEGTTCAAESPPAAADPQPAADGGAEG
ncbi:alpha/beta hydrolase [Actinomyces johnsonii]|uniref:alpha/beta hydrolase n=1 Tax=Actinomyces johnsonii TaxID=544581 RepID=UPI003F93DC1D